MPSRKKNRGKQRKARQKDNCRSDNEAPPINAIAGVHDLDTPTPQAEKMIKQLKSEGFRIEKQDDGSTFMGHPNAKPDADPRAWTDRGLLNDKERQQLAQNYVHNYAQDMREGDFHGTQVILDNLTKSLAPPLVDELLKADIHLSFLHFLNQSDKSVSDILGRVVDAGESIKLPYYWVGILGLLAQDGFSVDAREEARLTVAKGIEPFVTSVIDGKRELFRSNHIWHLCLTPFFELIREVMKSKGGFLAMVSYEGFLPFVAQASCWSQSRDDIVEECRLLRRHRRVPMTIPRTTLEGCGKAQQLIASLMWEHEDELDKAERRVALDQIACTRLLSNDPTCNDSTIVGFVRMMNETGEEQDQGYLRNCVVVPLLLMYDYVDARVIAELIEYGRNNRSMEAAETVLNLMVSILGQDKEYDHNEQIDTRFGAAIRHGLLEFSIDALVAYGDENDNEIGEDLYYIAYGLRSMAMHSKTSRALKEREEGIATALDELRKTYVAQSDDICSLIDDAICDSAPTTCCNCLKEVDRKELLYCKRCGVECYCSSACQSESYGLGHDKLCKEIAKHPDRAFVEGLGKTELKRLTVLSSNLIMNGCEYVRSKAAEILDAVQDDVEVTVDYGDFPPVVAVSRNEVDECPGPGGVRFKFIAPVYYDFAEKVDLGEIVLEKVIPRRSLAHPPSASIDCDGVEINWRNPQH